VITAGASRVAPDPLCLHAVATTPAGSMKPIRSLPLHRLRPSPDNSWVGSCIISFVACSLVVILSMLVGCSGLVYAQDDKSQEDKPRQEEAKPEPKQDEAKPPRQDETSLQNKRSRKQNKSRSSRSSRSRKTPTVRPSQRSRLDMRARPARAGTFPTTNFGLTLAAATLSRQRQ